MNAIARSWIRRFSLALMVLLLAGPFPGAASPNSIGGIALHTMPGSSASGSYGFDNPQASAFAAIEQRIGAVRIIAEPIWAAIEADDGYDSSLLLLGGVKFPIRNVWVSIGTGAGWWTFGSGAAALFPVPPLLTVSFDL